MRPNLSYQKQSAGFALIAAIFLVVVVGLAITYMQRLSSNQADVNIQAVQNTRALQAAQSGLDWGVYQIVNGTNCAASTNFTLDQISAGMNVTVVCSEKKYDEAGVTKGVTVYTITSTAEQGTLGTPDYSYKKMQASIEIPS